MTKNALATDMAGWIDTVEFVGPATDDAMRLAVRAMTDCIGVALAGSRSPSVGAVVRALRRSCVSGGITIWGQGHTAEVLSAALANGTAAHALDYDDTNHPLYGHPSSHLVPTVFALGEEMRCTGAEIVEAYLIGFEVEVRLARAMNMHHHLAGWHATATLGTMGSVAAASRLLGLRPDTIASTLAIAASMAGGLRANFGTMTKAVHAGLAARNGVLAALLGHAGLTASSEALDGPGGFVEMFTGGRAHSGAVDVGAFGDPWEICMPFGLAIKPYPSCGATHPAIEAAQLIASRGIDPTSVAHIRVETSSLALVPLVFHRPRTANEARFSMEYCVAAALAFGRAGLSEFQDHVVRSAAVQALVEKVDVSVAPGLAELPEFPAIVTVETSSGDVLTERVDIAKGKPARPLSDGEVRDKFVENASMVMATPKAADLLSKLACIAESRNIASLVAMMRLQ